MNGQTKGRNINKIAALFLAAIVVLVMIPITSGSANASSFDYLSDQQKKSSYGFFLWLSENAKTDAEKKDASIAAQILTNKVDSGYKSNVFNNGTITASSRVNITFDELIGYTKIGEENDATTLVNLKDAVSFVQDGNACRAKEKLEPLKISSALMAMSEVNANYVKTEFAHTCAFRALENLACRQIGGKWKYGKVDGVSDDPYEGWYTKEKENYEKHNGSQTGHYETMTDRKGTMTITGFGVSHKFESQSIKASDGEYYDCIMDNKYYSQHFSDGSSMYAISKGITVSEYQDYLNRYQCAVLGHTWNEGTVSKTASCVQKGEKTYTCNVCGEKKIEKTAIDQNNHTGGTYIKNAKEATCGAGGYSGDTCCKGCGNIISKGTVVPATGKHVYDNGKITKEASIDSEGEITYTCSVCGNTKKEIIDKLIPKESEVENDKAQLNDENVSSGEPEAAPEKPRSAKVKKGAAYKISGHIYKVDKAADGSSKGSVTFVKSKNVKSVTVPATVRLSDGKIYKVEALNAGSFTGSKIRTVTVGKNVKKIVKYSFRSSGATKVILKTRLLKKSTVRGSFKNSKVRTVLIKVGSKKQNKSYAKKYRKIFTNRNCGKKAAVK